MFTSPLALPVPSVSAERPLGVKYWGRHPHAAVAEAGAGAGAGAGASFRGGGMAPGDLAMAGNNGPESPQINLQLKEMMLGGLVGRNQSNFASTNQLHSL